VDEGRARSYWRANVRMIAILLVIWFVVSFGFGILFVEQMNALGSVFGAPLGFWFAQQGSIVTFVVLIGVYAWGMDRIDDAHGVAERDEHGRRF
jgi:putative solute:sodium symporter small subunit